MKVVIVHDYLTQKGGAERVTLTLSEMFPDAPIYTTLYNPHTTYPEFQSRDVRPVQALNHLSVLRKDPRKALLVLDRAFARLDIGHEHEVTLCSTSGWAHRVTSGPPKLAYCHNPPRWLYQADEYLAQHGLLVRLGLRTLRRRLLAGDQRAAHSVAGYVANSRVVAERIKRAYGLAAAVVSPPVMISPAAGVAQVDGLEPGYLLTVARGRAYKNTDAIVRAAKRLDGRRLVVVGGPSAPDREGDHAVYLRDLADDQMRWLYANASVVVSAAHEDFGLTPLEGNAFGTPSALIARGGFLETTVEGRNGSFFAEPSPSSIADAIARAEALERTAVQKFVVERFGQRRFEEQMRAELLRVVERPRTDAP